MKQYLNYNGKVSPVEPPMAGEQLSWMQARGIFETMRISNKKILHSDQHFNRLLNGLRAMGFVISPDLDIPSLSSSVIELCKANGHDKAARARLAVYQDDFSTLSIDSKLSFIIESWELSDEYFFDEEGLTIAIYPHATKQSNDFSLYKTTTYFPYRHAADFAREQQFGDCLLLNTAKRICDSSISNIFWIKDQVVRTPPLSEGCIDGALRKYLLEKMPGAGFTTSEERLSVQMLLAADEVFLTNVIKGIRPVKQFQKSGYTHTLTRQIFDKVVAPLTKS